MKTNHLIALLVVLWVVDRYNRSHYGTSAIDTAYTNEVDNFTAMEGTNFTNSLWDPISGQPTYQFGTLDVPGGDGVMGTPSYSGVFGHL